MLKVVVVCVAKISGLRAHTLVPLSRAYIDDKERSLFRSCWLER